VLEQATGNLNSQDSPWIRIIRSHHLPPYSILCACPWDRHPNGILSQDSQMGISKFPKLGLLRLWGRISFCAYLRLIWGLKKSYSTHGELSNGMSHATWTQINRCDSRLLMVGSQIANLTLDPSFGYNLCSRCPNGSCEPILNIYVPRDFQWYKEILNPMGFDPCNCSLKIQDSNSQNWEFTWGCGGSILTLNLLGSMKCES
jgi:hypothetical protein